MNYRCQTSPRDNCYRAGFTLMELLVTMAVILILAGMGMAMYHGASDKTKMVREVSSARTLITAYLAHAQENDGIYMPVIDKSAGTSAKPVYYAPENRKITFMEAPHRYPWRLAPYFEYEVSKVILINGMEDFVKKTFGKSGPMYDYGVSMSSTLGMNINFVGGYMNSDGSYNNPDELIIRRTDSPAPILAFASAGGMPGEGVRLKGYFKVEPPTGSNASPSWSSTPWSNSRNGGDYGAVDARYNGQAVCAFLDGTVRVMDIEDLRDMRLWSKNAWAKGDPNYRIGEGE